MTSVWLFDHASMGLPNIFSFQLPYFKHKCFTPQMTPLATCLKCEAGSSMTWNDNG